MTNLDRATKIRRTVAHKAYQLLRDCKEPEQVFDGYNMREQEHWYIEKQDLEEAVIDELADEWPEADDNKIISQIQFFVKKYLASQGYEDDKKKVRNRYYQYKREQQDIEATNRAHMPKWRP